MRCCPVVAAVLVLAVASLASGAAQEATPAVDPAAPRLTPIVVSAIGSPLRVPGSDGLEHIAYDLVVTNAFSAPVALTAVEVFDRGGERALRLTGADLVAATQPLFGLTPTAEIPASGTVAVMIDIAVPVDQTPDRLTHRIAYAFPPDAPGATQVGTQAIEGPELTVDARAPVVIAPPVHGPGWLNAFSCCDATSIHRGVRAAVDGLRLVKSETFAIDWVRLRGDRFYAGDGVRNDQWFGYGADVTAVAPGTVVYIRDGQPDETPNTPPRFVKRKGDGGGNQVIVQIAPNVWAFYAHLQPGSVAVAVGDEVSTGQAIGRLGNSGNSIGPHLHFGLIDGADPLTANSVPMVIDRYDLTGTVDPASLFASLTDPGALVVQAEPTIVPQTRTLPLNLTVTDFR